MLQCSFSLAAAQLLVKMTSALQKSQCCSATSAAQHSKNCSATSVFACGMLQGWGLEEWGLGLPDQRYPPIARYGVFGVSTWPIGCDTPSPFSQCSPLGSMRSGGAIPPPLKRGISAILVRYPIKTRQMGAIPPSAILSRKGIAR